MPQTPILVPARLRRPPKTGWSWVDRRFVREHAERLSREAMLLYFFLAAVADRAPGRIDPGTQGRFRYDAAAPYFGNQVVLGDNAIAVLHEVNQ